MLLALNICYNQFSYGKILEVLHTYDKQVNIMRNVAEKLEQLESNAPKDYQEESAESLFDISHAQRRQHRNHLPLTHDQHSPQLPVLALKPDKFSFSKTTTDLRI